MGDTKFRVVPGDMDADAALWSGASGSLGKAVTAVPELSISFGRFEDSVGEKYTAADKAVRASIVTGEKRLEAMATNVNANNTRTKKNDSDSDSRVRGAGSRGGGGGGAQGDTGPGGDTTGGKGKDHYSELMGGNPMPADPKDPEITFDRRVDPDTGEVTWTPRAMKPGEAVATDGRDVERIPQRADRIVVTMLDGEPQITYVDNEAVAHGDEGRRADVRWESSPGTEAGPVTEPTGRVVAGSGALEPGPIQSAPQTEWTRALPEGADFAVVEVRDGEPHLVFLDVEGREVSQVSDSALTDAVGTPEKEVTR